MRPVFKSQHKADNDEQQRRYYWGLTPQQRLALALRLTQQARAIYAANPAALPHGRRVLTAVFRLVYSIWSFAPETRRVASLHPYTNLEAALNLLRLFRAEGVKYVLVSG